MEIPVLIRSLNSSILSSTSSQLDDTFWGVVSAAVEQSRSKANMVAKEDRRLTQESIQKINEDGFFDPLNMKQKV